MLVRFTHGESVMSIATLMAKGTTDLAALFGADADSLLNHVCNGNLDRA